MIRAPLKWAGGKSLLAPRILELLGDPGDRIYYEPFVGSGAVLWAMRQTYPDCTCVIGDANKTLMQFYVDLQQTPIMLHSLICKMPWGLDWKTHYTEIRKHFNQNRGMPVPAVQLEQSASFYWLNKTGFNGLYRVNAKGEFNVPCGEFASDPKPPNYNEWLLWSHALQEVFTSAEGNFLRTKPRTGALEYADPPYDPDRKGGFTSYAAVADWQFQCDLANRLNSDVEDHGCRVVASNHATPRIMTLYQDLGFTAELVDERRRISCNGNREAAKGVLFHKGA